MPLPTKDPVAFRGVPSLGAEKKVALSMTLTQKQVEAMFARQSALREQGSSQYPLEIDFDDNKILIGDVATPFSSIKEDGTREICQRSPTVSKPLAGISLSGIVIGKLNIHRDFDQDVADKVRKATEAEHAKRNERTIIPLDNPPVLNNGKKGRSGASTLAKKAMSNRIVSAQAASNRTSNSSPASRTSTPVASSSTISRTKPPSSSARPAPPSSRANSVSARPPTPATPASSSATSKDSDLTSLRARLTHYLALDSRTTKEVLFEIGGLSPSPEIVREIESTLKAVAQEIPPPKKGPEGPVLWELQWGSWGHVRPYEWPDLTSDQRTRMARKGRLACGQMDIPSTDPLWEHFKTRVSTDFNALPPPGKGKAKAVAGQTLVKKSDFKGGMFPKEKKPSTKGGGVVNGGVTKTKAASTKSKVKKDQEDEVEAKVRKVVDGLAADTKGKGKGISSSSTASFASTTKIPKKKHDEDIIPSGTKARSSLGTVKRESPPTPKPRRIQDEGGHKRRPADVDADATSEMEEGEVLVQPPAKKPRVSGVGEPSKPRVLNKQGENRDAITKKNTKERDRVVVKEESAPPKPVKDVSAAPRVSVDASSSSSRTVAPGNKSSRLEKEERGREERDMDRLKERDREKRRPNGKRGRRATPSFSSDEEEEEEQPKKPATSIRGPPAATSKPKLPPHPPSSKVPISSGKPTSAPLSRAPAPSPTLPSGKEALRRRYHICYARYMGVTSQFYEQRAKVEALLATDAESMSADDDMDMMSAEELMQLRGEHERLRDELERILHEHANAISY